MAQGPAGVLELYAAALELQTFMEKNQWRFCFIGGLAVLRWGEQRMTRDVDTTLFTNFENESDYIDILLSQYQSRQIDAREFAQKNAILLLQSSTKHPLDIALAGLPFESRVVDRSSLFKFPGGFSLRTASAEDLIVTKAFANRDQDWIDIKGMIIRQGDKLDWNIIRSELPPLCELKGEPEIVDRLEKLKTSL